MPRQLYSQPCSRIIAMAPGALLITVSGQLQDGQEDPSDPWGDGSPTRGFTSFTDGGGTPAFDWE
ncbi:MAG: hypothetical protein J6M53_02635 [Bacteroidaceae bacterium]|nr:hypothetical protein [Bacteroidaceae bacterium]